MKVLFISLFVISTSLVYGNSYNLCQYVENQRMAADCFSEIFYKDYSFSLAKANIHGTKTGRELVERLTEVLNKYSHAFSDAGTKVEMVIKNIQTAQYLALITRQDDMPFYQLYAIDKKGNLVKLFINDIAEDYFTFGNSELEVGPTFFGFKPKDLLQSYTY